VRLHGVKTCHTDGNVTGLQFFMAEDPYQSVGEVPYDMKPIGPMTGECDYLELKEGLDEIKATLRNNESGLSMMYQIKDSPNEMKVEYGNVKLVRRTKWEFNDANPLVGLYGRQTATGITQLGFITLDTACQAAHEEVIVDPSDPSSPAGQTEDPTANTNTQQPLPSQPDQTENLDLVATEEQAPADSGLSFLTLIFIAVGAVLGLTVLIVTCCVLKNSINNNNKLTTTPVTTLTTIPPQKTAPSYPDTDFEANPSVNYSSAQSLKGTAKNKEGY